MSFWMGMARGFKDADDKKTQDRRITEERAYDASVREDARKFETSMFWTKLAEDRRSALIQARAARSGTAAKVDPDSQRNLHLLGARLQGVEGGGELMNAAIMDPTVASNIVGTIQEAERKAAEAGQKGFRISGQQLVDNFQVFGTEGMLEAIPSFEDIMAADMADPEVFGSLTESMAAGSAPSFGVDVNADIFHQPNIPQEKYAAEVFTNAVLEAAKVEASRLAETDEVAAADLFSKIRLAGTEEGAVEMMELRDKFGESALQNLEQFTSTGGVRDNPGISSLPQSTEPRRSFATVEDIQAAINSGDLSEGDTVILNGQEIPITFND